MEISGVRDRGRKARFIIWVNTPRQKMFHILFPIKKLKGTLSYW